MADRNRNIMIVGLIIVAFAVFQNLGTFTVFSDTQHSTYTNFQTTSSQIKYTTQSENTNAGFTNKHFLEDGGSVMCSTCAFESNRADYTSAISYLSGWCSNGDYWNPCEGQTAETYAQAAADSFCEVKGKIDVLCGSSIHGDRCAAFSHPYEFFGSVTFNSENGFVCNLDNAREQLKEELPSTYIRPDGETRAVELFGFEGEVIFKRGTVPECSDVELTCGTETDVNLPGTFSYLCIDTQWSEQGEEIIDLCDVECLLDNNCLDIGLVGDTFCDGNTLKQNYSNGVCVNAICQEEIPYESTLEVCELACAQEPCSSDFCTQEVKPFDCLTQEEYDIVFPITETCNDGIKNQDETGIDCGGICTACDVDGNETGNGGGGTDACPNKCTQLYEIIDNKCFYDFCGSGCGANNLTTFDTIEECKEKLPKDSILDKLLGPTFILIIVITGIIFFMRRKK